MFITKNITHFLLFFIMFFAPSVVCSQSTTAENPKNVEIFTDIHGVLVVANKNRVSANLEYQEIGSLLLRAPFNGSSRATITAIIHLLRSGNMTGESFYRVFKDNGQEKLAQMVLAIANDYRLMPKMETLVAQLHDRGYTVRVASNIGNFFYDELKIKFPALFKMFSEGVTVQVVDETGKNIPKPIQKPNRAFYQEMEERFNPDHNKTVIFIDDNEKNTQAASQAYPHWQVIHFKNPEQTIADIEKLLHISLSSNQ